MLDVYYKPDCPYCKSAVDIMEQKKLKHKIHMLETENERQEMKKKHNFNTFPQIFYNGKFIGGKDDFVKLINMCQKLGNIMNGVDNDVVGIVSGLCSELNSGKQKRKFETLLKKKK